MNRIVKATVFLFALLVVAGPAMAQTMAQGGTRSDFGITFSGAFAAGLVVMGAAYGIGKLGAAALESMARQPEIAGSIQTAMIIAAALIEGFTFYAIFVCSQQNPWFR